MPLQGVASYRFLQNGVTSYDINVPSTRPTPQYFSPANALTGIAIGNIYSTTSISVSVNAVGNDGSTAQGVITVPPFGHRALLLREAIPTLSSSFVGTVTLYSASLPPDYFVALTLKTDNGSLYSSLPSGALALPVSQYDRIWNVFARVQQAARTYIPSPDNIQLTISSDPTVNASANINGITIYLALAELIADSESELAFVVGHELGHVYQFRTGIYRYNVNPEWDADTWGLVLSLTAGYDPYAGAGALAKMYMATGQAGLSAALFEALSSSDMHKSLNQRLDGIQTTISSVCSLAQYTATCTEYRLVFHPHMPGGLLMTTEPN